MTTPPSLSVGRTLFINILLVALYGCSSSVDNQFGALRVAHAGGGIDGETYTNSIDALNQNIEKGFKYFEIDFSFTSDNQLVCLHDWEKSFTRSFNLEPYGKVSLDEFKALTSTHSKYEKCTLRSLSEWLDKNPEAFLVTDVKENNLDALRKISQTVANHNSRVIPQIYYPENFEEVKNMGYEQIIWTLYKYSGTADRVIEETKSFHGDFAITMPTGRLKSGIAADLKDIGIPSYVHTINDETIASQYIEGYGITEIYTDFLPPSKK